MDWRKVRYDAIVIGSGAAGGMAAKTLTNGGASVLLLEAGPERSPEACRPQKRSRQEFEAIKARQPIQSQNLQYSSENCHLFVDDLENPYSTQTPTQFNWIRSRQTGGRTLVWSRFALRLSDEDLKGAEEDGIGEPWPICYQDLAPYYDKVERTIGVQGTKESLPSLPDGQFLPRQVPEFLRRAARASRATLARKASDSLSRGSERHSQAGIRSPLPCQRALRSSSMRWPTTHSSCQLCCRADRPGSSRTGSRCRLHRSSQRGIARGFSPCHRSVRFHD